MRKTEIGEKGEIYIQEDTKYKEEQKTGEKNEKGNRREKGERKRQAGEWNKVQKRDERKRSALR